MMRAIAQLMSQAAEMAMQQAATVSIASIGQALTEAGRLSSKQLAFLERAFTSGPGGGIPPDMLLKAHERVGAAAQLSVQQAFTHRPNRQHTSPYRMAPRFDRNRRQAGGALLRAIQAPDFFEATPEGINFGNESRLDREASHWRRINFGAMPDAGQAPGRFTPIWNGVALAALGLTDQPSPAFRLPVGYWIVPGGERAKGNVVGAEFYPQGEQPAGTLGRPSRARMARGIEASQFLDAGVRRIAQELPREYSALVADIFRNPALNQTIESRIGVRAPRPVAQRFRVRID